MKILIVNYEYPPLGGGGGIGCYLIAKELAKKYQVDLITSNYGNRFPSYKKEDGMAIYRVFAPCRKSWQSASFFSMFSYVILAIYKGISLKKNNYDLIHTYFGMPSGIVGITLSWFYRKPNILTLIGGEIFDQDKLELEYYRSPIIRILMRWIVKKSNFLSAISTDTANGVKKWLKVNKSIRILPFPIKNQHQLVETKCIEDKVRLVCVSRIVKRKGINLLIEWFRRLDKKRFELHIIGDGEEMQSIKRLVSDYELTKNVKFYGFVSEEKKFKILNYCHIFVLPTMHEGQGLCFLEAMSCGLPIVTYNNGGQTDFLLSGRNGFLTGIFDIKQSVKAIKLLAKDKNLYQKISKENQRRVKDFLVRNIVPKYEELYSYVLNNSFKT